MFEAQGAAVETDNLARDGKTDARAVGFGRKEWREDIFCHLGRDCWARVGELNLQLGEAAEAILIPRGSFYQATGGKWIYVLDATGEKAYRREIRIGRQNPQYYEVVEGLQPGAKVIVSSYDNFGDN